MKITVILLVVAFLLFLVPILPSDAASIISKIQGLDDDSNDAKNTLASIEEGSSKNYEKGQEFVPKIRRKLDFFIFLSESYLKRPICRVARYFFAKNRDILLKKFQEKPGLYTKFKI
jgi:hypothetical protein